jgi:hypothetical protein
MRLIAPLIRMIGEQQAVLQEDYCVCLGAEAPDPALALVIWAGFVFDGQSVPRLLWPIIGHPFSGRSIAAALVHDALYCSELLPRADSDRIFRRFLDNGRALSACKWLGVRAGGWLTWRAHTPISIAAARNYVQVYRRADWTGSGGCEMVTCSRRAPGHDEC